MKAVLIIAFILMAGLIRGQEADTIPTGFWLITEVYQISKDSVENLTTLYAPGKPRIYLSHDLRVMALVMGDSSEMQLLGHLVPRNDSLGYHNNDPHLYRFTCTCRSVWNPGEETENLFVVDLVPDSFEKYGKHFAYFNYQPEKGVLLQLIGFWMDMEEAKQIINKIEK
jgi:hypothetical protein